MQPLKNDTYLPALTGVRAIAAYMVYLHHYNPFAEGTLAFDITKELYTGVTLFFVLSGFLIAFRYFGQEHLSFRKYMVNRIARIYPMYFLLTTATFIYIHQTGAGHTLNEVLVYLSNITFLRGYFENYKFSGVAQGWSLTVEETFYFTAPVFFMLIKKQYRNLVLIPLLLMVTGILLVALFQNRNVMGFMNTYDFMFNYTFFGRCFEFFIGIGLALVLSRYREKITFRYATYTGLAITVASIAALALLKGDAEFGIRVPAGKVLNNVLMPFCGIAVFYYGLITETTLVSRLLGSKVFVLLGKSSYVFYLIHKGIIMIAVEHVSANTLFGFIVINAISILLFLGIEDPLNHFIRRKLNKAS